MELHATAADASGRGSSALRASACTRRFQGSRRLGSTDSGAPWPPLGASDWHAFCVVCIRGEFGSRSEPRPALICRPLPTESGNLGRGQVGATTGSRHDSEMRRSPGRDLTLPRGWLGGERTFRDARKREAGQGRHIRSRGVRGAARPAADKML